MLQPFAGERARLHTLLPDGLFLRTAAFPLPEFFFRRGFGFGSRIRFGCRIFGYGLPADRFHDVEQGELRGSLLLLPLGLPPGAESLPFLLREAEKVIQGHDRLLRDGFLRFRPAYGRFLCGSFRCPRYGMSLPRHGNRPHLSDAFLKAFRPYIYQFAQLAHRREAEIKVKVEVFRQVLVQHPFQVCGDGIHAPVMQEDACRFAVGVGSHMAARMDNGGGTLEVFVLCRAVLLRTDLDEGFFKAGIFPFGCRVLLQHNEVAAHLRTGIVGKQVVGQADGGQEPRPFHQVLAHGSAHRGVHHPL